MDREFSIKICKEIEQANHDDNIKLIELLIDSGGGDESWKLITSFVKNSPKPIHTIVIGRCYSSATLILQSGHKRFASENANFLIHAGGFGTQGSLDYFNNIVQNEKNEQIIRNKYRFHRTSLSGEFQKSLTTGENYFGAKEALEYGLIDEII